MEVLYIDTYQMDKKMLINIIFCQALDYNIQSWHLSTWGIWLLLAWEDVI